MCLSLVAVSGCCLRKVDDINCWWPFAPFSSSGTQLMHCTIVNIINNMIILQVVIKLTEEEQTIYSGEGRMTGILMPDATLFPSNDSLPLECVCVEIKPKYGGITRCDTISPINRKIKRSNSRYRLHQYLKLSQGRIAEASSYDPQDLFSGNSERIKSALMSLLTNPQNNFALFINGKRVSLESGLSQAASILFDAKINGSENSSNISLTVSLLLMNILMQEHILLERILRLQMSCRYDIEGVFRLYRRLLALENNDVGEMDEGSCATQPDDCQRRALSKLLRLSKPESIAVLRSYCLATTAKDCSMMITVAKNVSVENPNLNRCQSPGWSLRSCGQLDFVLNGVTNSFLYKISLVDMDRKPLSKIPIHMELDEEIMKAARCFV